MLFSAKWNDLAQLPLRVVQLDKKAGRATKVDGAVGSSAIAEQDMSTQLSGWMTVEAAARLVRMGCSYGY